MAIEVQLVVNSGAPQTGGITVGSTDSIQPQLNANLSSGVWTVLWEVYEYPPGATTPSGWDADTTAETFYFTATAATALKPPAIDVTGQPWGKWLIRATANNGVAGGVPKLQSTRDESAAFSVLSPEGWEDIGALEESQFHAKGALIAVKEDLRKLSGSFVEETVVSADVGVGWVTLGTYALSTLVPTDDRVRELRAAFGVIDSAGSTRDVVGLVATVYRLDSGTDTLTNEDEGTSSSTSVSWTFTLTRATTDLALRLAFSGSNVLLQAQQHATLDRTISGDLYLGPVR